MITAPVAACRWSRQNAPRAAGALFEGNNMQVKLCWEEMFINWLTYNSNRLRQRARKSESNLNCIEMDRLLFDDIHPFFELVRSDVKQDEADLRAIIRDGVAMLEQTWGNTEETIAKLEAAGEELGQPWTWLKRAKAAL